VIFIIPVVKGLGLSLFQWDGLSKNSKFVGFSNYIRLFTANTKFGEAMVNTIIYMVFSVVVATILGLLIACLIYRGSRINYVFRLIFYLPGILSTVGVSFMWIYAIYNPNFGIINIFLEAIGLHSLTRIWLGDKNLIICMVAVVQVYMDLGLNMILFIAGLQNIPLDYYEAADIEGVGVMQKFFYITLPSLKVTISLVLLLEMISAVKSFDLIFLLDSTNEVLSTYLFREMFIYGRIGTGCATAVILLALVFVFNFMQGRLIREDG
jgi:raffinose/stachyose/melibiose transport system permease protein